MVVADEDDVGACGLADLDLESKSFSLLWRSWSKSDLSRWSMVVEGRPEERSSLWKVDPLTRLRWRTRLRLRLRPRRSVAEEIDSWQWWWARWMWGREGAVGDGGKGQLGVWPLLYRLAAAKRDVVASHIHVGVVVKGEGVKMQCGAFEVRCEVRDTDGAGWQLTLPGPSKWAAPTFA